MIAFLGDPPYEPEFLDRAKASNRELLENVGIVKQLPLHTFDPFTAKGQLQAAYDAFAYQNQNVSVAHVSSLNYFTETYSRGDSGHVDLDLDRLLCV